MIKNKYIYIYIYNLFLKYNLKHKKQVNNSSYVSVFSGFWPRRFISYGLSHF